jgi:hypothetical protein
MTKSSTVISTGGAWLVVLSALGGMAVSIANYFNVESGIAGEPGTILVIASTALLAIFGWLMVGDDRRGGVLRVFVLVASLLDIAGTAFAGYLLHSTSLVVLMFVSLLGWLLHVFGRRRA